GIRDFHVTGVQTCALPISSPKMTTPVSGCTQRCAGASYRKPAGDTRRSSKENVRADRSGRVIGPSSDGPNAKPSSPSNPTGTQRSEERRVDTERKPEQRNA